MEEKPLWEATRDLHHACEAHPVGAAMATGNPPRIWYAAWLKALHQIHEVIDASADWSIVRAMRVNEDLNCMEFQIDPLHEATHYVSVLDNQTKIDGAIYVLTGAHLMGGEIMRRRLDGFPTRHLEWDDRKQALATLQTYRTRGELAEAARSCFNALLAIMDEIQNKYPV